ncbi:MAG: hypothetical protein V7750_19410 [Sneathiella sp.]
MTSSKIFKYMLSVLVVFSGLTLQAHAQQIKLNEETKKMRQQYSGSELGKFIKNRQEDSQKLRLFMNSLHRESMRISASIQQNLVAKRNAPKYRELYVAKEQDFVSLRFCIEAHKHFNGVTQPARINAAAALWYTAAVKECDSPLLKNYLKTQGGMANLWRHFNGLVEKSIPIEKTKKNNYQNGYTEFVSAQTQKNLGAYKSAPYAKMLRPDQAPAAAPVAPVTVSGGDLPPLPIVPFKHDQEEWAVITKHIKGLVDRIQKSADNNMLVNACRSVIQSEKHKKYSMMACTQSIYLFGSQLPAMKTSTDALYKFSPQYDESASAPQRQEAAVKVEAVRSMALPTGKPQYVVAELTMYRNAMKSSAPATFERCNYTDTAGLTDDLKIAKNKTAFLKVTRGLLVCAQNLYNQDRTKYARLYKNLNSYFRGARSRL